MLLQNYWYGRKWGMNKCQKKVNFLLFILFWHFDELFGLDIGLFLPFHCHNDRLVCWYLFSIFIVSFFLQQIIFG